MRKKLKEVFSLTDEERKQVNKFKEGVKKKFKQYKPTKPKLKKLSKKINFHRLMD